MDDQQLLESASKEQLRDTITIWTALPAALARRPEPGDPEALARVEAWRHRVLDMALSKGVTTSMQPELLHVDDDLVTAVRENRCNILGGFTSA